MSRQIVAVCSACAGWYLRDEASGASEALLRRNLREEVLLVIPDLWWYESVNLLRSAAARGRITAQAAHRALYYLEEISLKTVRVERIGRGRILDMAQRMQSPHTTRTTSHWPSYWEVHW